QPASIVATRAIRRSSGGLRVSKMNDRNTGTPSRKRRSAMIRLLGMRLMTRLLLVVCSLSLISILFLSRCGLNTLEPESDEQEGQAGAAAAVAVAQGELPGNAIPLISPVREARNLCRDFFGFVSVVGDVAANLDVDFRVYSLYFA
ncbi:hypothetical protein Trydic_g8449, partial [Trypoxylus dichotomus]